MSSVFFVCDKSFCRRDIAVTIVNYCPLLSIPLTYLLIGNNLIKPSFYTTNSDSKNI